MRSRDRRVLQLQRLRKEYERKLQENASLMEENQSLKATCDTLRGQIHVKRVFLLKWVGTRNSASRNGGKGSEIGESRETTT